MKKILLLCTLLAGCLEVPDEDPCGPAPERPGVAIESKDGRVSMDRATWTSLATWMDETVAWRVCVESL